LELINRVSETTETINDVRKIWNVAEDHVGGSHLCVVTSQLDQAVTGRDQCEPSGKARVVVCKSWIERDLLLASARSPMSDCREESSRSGRPHATWMSVDFSQKVRQTRSLCDLRESCLTRRRQTGSGQREFQDRSHRMGQQHPATVFTYTCEATIEQRIDEIISGKQTLFDLARPT
jgi:hypothetical protein